MYELSTICRYGHLFMDTFMEFWKRNLRNSFSWNGWTSGIRDGFIMQDFSLAVDEEMGFFSADIKKFLCWPFKKV